MWVCKLLGHKYTKSYFWQGGTYSWEYCFRCGRKAGD